MRFFLVLLHLTFLICSSCGNVADNNSIISAQRMDLVTFGNTRRLIEEFAENLRKSAQQVIEATGNFTIGIHEEIKLFTEKINTDLQKFQGLITDAIKTVSGRFTDTGEIVAGCIESYRLQADSLISQTFTKTTACADDRIKELGSMIQDLTTQSVNALEYANNALESMRNCTEIYAENILHIGSCLGPIALQTQTKGTIFFTQSGISIARINLAIGTLPAAFEICAGSNMMEASIGTAKLLMEIGSCSVSTIFSSFLFK